MKSLTIVGAGPAGCHLAICLLRKGIVKPQDLTLLDPHPPLWLWEKRCRNSGMTHLRSACVHHLGLSSSALISYQKRYYPKSSLLVGKVQCPELGLFQSHCRFLIEEFQLQSLWQRGHLQKLTRRKGHYRLQTEQGDLVSERVVLALGSPWIPHTPVWLESCHDRVSHLLDPQASLEHLREGLSVAVLGGGMTAAQAALHLSKRQKVSLLTRSEFKMQEFDVEPGWMGPVPASFTSLPPSRRRELNQVKRRNGTLNSRTLARLRRAIHKGEIDHHVLQNPEVTPKGELLDHWGRLHVDHIYLGTGFGGERCQDPLCLQIAQDLGAPVAPWGAPLAGEDLQWLPGLFVLGSLAELVVGPASRNILGARLAAERVVAACA